jgi:hypothetical protein
MLYLAVNTALIAIDLTTARDTIWDQIFGITNTASAITLIPIIIIFAVIGIIMMYFTKAFIETVVFLGVFMIFGMGIIGV